MSTELETFLQKYPAYKQTQKIDDLRKTDYARLDSGEHVYFDYTGGGIYAESQIQKHYDLLKLNVFGNPHSTNPTSQAATHLVEGTRDYIVTHFKTNSRVDTDYWRACAANGHLSDALQELYRQWLGGQGVARDVGKQVIGKGYPVFSWYCLLAGTGCFPPQPRAADARDGRVDLAEIDDFLRRSAAHFLPHREALRAIPPRRRGKSLQLYLW